MTAARYCARHHVGLDRHVAWFHVGFGSRLDQLSLAWLEIITFVGLLIHLYAAQSMYEEDGYSRFFCYMNLFVGSMLTLVLADNLLLLYLGWEGVGLCSYLLIGFWYKERVNCDSARKAFIVTRIGDTALAIALFVIAGHCRTSQYREHMELLAWPVRWR